MMMISKINSLQSAFPKIGEGKHSRVKTSENFKVTLNEFLQDVNSLQKEAKQATESFVNGDISDLHQVTVAAEKARLSFELLLEIRNKMMESYQEIMRMQV